MKRFLVVVATVFIMNILRTQLDVSASSSWIFFITGALFSLIVIILEDKKDDK